MLLRNILLALGALFVLAGLALAVVWLRGMNSETAVVADVPVAPSGSAVMVALAPLPAGTLLRPTDIGWKDISPGEIRPGNLQRGQMAEADLLGTVTRRDFAEGEALIASELVMPGDRRFLAAVLKPGLRAASIAVEAPQIASGLILPGDRVDVILTQNFDTGDLKRKAVGETVLENLRVVGVGSSLGGEAKPPSAETATPTNASSIPKTVTLELSQHQAEILFVASQIGSLQLAVRPLEGTVVIGTSEQLAAPTWASDVSPALSEIGGAAPLRPMPPTALNVPPSAPGSPKPAVVAPASARAPPAPPPAPEPPPDFYKSTIQNQIRLPIGRLPRNTP